MEGRAMTDSAAIGAVRANRRHLTVLLPLAALAGGVAAGASDVRFTLLAGAVVLGWTQLVGL